MDNDGSGDVEMSAVGESRIRRIIGDRMVMRDEIPRMYYRDFERMINNGEISSSSYFMDGCPYKKYWLVKE